MTATGLAVLTGALLFSVPVPAQASQVPSPTITGSAKPFSGAYTAANLFAPGRNEFATAGQGACSAPLTTATNNGTWVELDFGATVSFDRFIVATRANTVDVVGTNVLYVGDNPVHSLNDTVFTWSSAGQNGSAPIRNLGGTVSGRYARWEVLSAPGSSKNLGGRHIWFLRKPDNMNVLPAPAVIAGTPSFFGPNYAPAHLADGGCGNDACGEEYAMRSADSPSGFNVDFDFGEPTQISGFDFLEREVDFFPQLTFVFANDTNFTAVLASNTWTNNPANYNLWTSGTFAPVTARYVRLAGTGYLNVNPGGREVIFYTPTGQMPSATQNPQGGSFYVDDLVSLTVVARGDPPLFYQWREGSLPLAGATNSTLTFPSLQASNTGSYTVVISNAFGSVTSAPALVTITNPPVDLKAGLVALYAFDETNGTAAADSSGNGYSATLYNFPTDDSMWVPGRMGNALAFNLLDSQTNNYVLTDLPLNFNDTDHFTFAFWARRQSDNNPYNPRFVVPVGSEHWVLWSPRQGVGFYPPAKSPEPALSVWTHFVVTYDRPNGKYELYVNGAKNLVAQNPANYVRTAPNSSVQNWVIGHNENLNQDSDPWRGFLDDLRIYNRILFPSEALALYNVAGLLPPSFNPQPQSTTLFLGETLRLASSVDGSPPIALQWQRNGTNLPGATLSPLIIPGATAADAGNYTLVASNALRTVTSAVAVVTIRPVTSITNGLAGYWKFDETSGSTAADSSGQGDAGTIVNANGDGGQWTAGKVGGALQFRGPAISGGAGDYVVVPAWPKARNGTMTLSAWVWADVLPVDRARIACGGSGTDGIGQFLFTLSSGTSQLTGYVEDAALAQTLAQEPQTFPTNSWQHVALVADGAMLHVYRNGVEVAASSYSGTLYNPTNALSIGARLTADDSAGESGWWQGKIDDVAYWTRGLSAGEIFELYAAGTAGKPATQADAFTNAPPLIAQGPQPTAVYLHDSFALQVKAAGVAPLGFQWWLGAAPVPGATNSVCAKAAAEFADAGNYRVVVTAGNELSVTSAPVALAVNAPAPALGRGLVLYLKLDETGGQTAGDSSANAANGALLNFPDPNTNWVPGLFGNALLFAQGAPAAEAVSVPDQPFLDFGAGPFSLSLWAKGPAAQSESGGLVCKGLGGGGEAFCVDIYGAAFRFFVRNSANQVPAGAAIEPGVPPNGQWQHLAVAYDPAQGQSRFFINGVLVGTGLTADSLEANSDPLDIGARQFQGGYTLPWTGLLDDIRLYNRAITSIEIRALTYQGYPPRLNLSWSGGQVTLNWPFEAVSYELQASASIGGTWSTVPGVTTNSVTLPAAGAASFYRLHRKVLY